MLTDFLNPIKFEKKANPWLETHSIHMRNKKLNTFLYITTKAWFDLTRIRVGG